MQYTPESAYREDIAQNLGPIAKTLYPIPFYTQIFNALADWSRYSGSSFQLNGFYSERQLNIVYGVSKLTEMEAYFHTHPRWLPIKKEANLTVLERVRVVWPHNGSIHVVTEEGTQFLFEQSGTVIDTNEKAIPEVVRLERETRALSEDRRKGYTQFMMDVETYHNVTRNFRNAVARASQLRIESGECEGMQEALEVAYFHLEQTENLLLSLRGMTCKLH